MKTDSFASEAGIIDATGSGLESISCLRESFNKSGQDLTVDLSDCVHDVQISSLQYVWIKMRSTPRDDEYE